ncbi:MAG: hypothetical protein LBI11_00010 [Streptococcaceae bacterium]|jgi:hypothetical protein|nr:hypothetical protein [Streptococcaceae bacterium]
MAEIKTDTIKVGQTITINPTLSSNMTVADFTLVLNGKTTTNKTGVFVPNEAGNATGTYNYFINDYPKTIYSGVEYIKVQDNEAPVYRLYNKVSMAHLYTTDENEKATLPTLDKNWAYEGISWQAATSGTSVYRLYNPTTGEHLYTKDTNEVSVLTTTAGWTKEGIAFYSSTAEDSATSIHRLYNPAAGVGSHLITMDANETSVLQTRGWKNEGIAWYSAFE